MLSTLAGVASAGRFDPAKLTFTLVALAVFLVLAFTLGQRGANTLLRRSLQASSGGTGLQMSAVMLIVLAFAAVTQAIGIEAVFGAFVAGVVIARSRYFRREVRETIHSMVHGLFAPIFFATAGMYVDLGSLADPTIALWAGIVLVVATVAKFAGSYIGARMGPLVHREALAVGAGLNARGALEIIIATIALSIGVFNQQSYTVIVLLAMTTSMMAPPLLRWALSGLDSSDEEAQRLEREELLAGSVIAKARAALLPTRGGANSAMAARVLDLALQDDAHVTVLSVESPDEPDARTMDRLSDVVAGVFGDRDTERRTRTANDVTATILDEARLGYDVVAVGLNEDFRGTQELSIPLRTLLSGSPVPLLIVRRSQRRPPADDEDYRALHFQRILVPATGTPAGRAAEELAYTIAERVDAEVDVVHVVSRRDRAAVGEPSAEGQLIRALSLAQRFGRGASPVLRVGSVASEEIIACADDRGVDLLVIGAQLRRHEDGRPFLGHGAEFVLEHAHQTVAVVVLPESATRA